MKKFLVLFIALVAEVQAGSCVCGYSKETYFDSLKFEKCIQDIYSNSNDTGNSTINCSATNQDSTTQAICDARAAVERSQEVSYSTCEILANVNITELIFVKGGQKIVLDELSSKEECRKTLLETPECR